MKTIGIIALSGACEKEKVLQAKEFLESKGFNVKLSKNIFDKSRYLAGSDEDKLSELKNFFEDKSIDIIMCARGGYGAIRLVENIDYDVIKRNPKIFCGFSDVTALLLMIYKKIGMITYHGPMATSDFALEASDLNHILLENETTYSWFCNAIKNSEISYSGNKIYKSGGAEGILWGGNLATVVSLCGLDFIPNQDFIFFTEDLNEPVYKIDKMFQQLINIKEFKAHCKAIILGDFLDCGNEEWLEEYWHELVGRLNIPVIGGFKITHNKDKITIPIGRLAKLEGLKISIK